MPLVPTRRRLGQELTLRIVDAAGAQLSIEPIAELVRVAFDDDDLGLTEIVAEGMGEGRGGLLDSLVGFLELDDCIFFLVQHDCPMPDANLEAEQPTLVAFAVVAPFASGLYVANLCTHPAARGRGIATTLLFECQDLAYELGRPALCGTVVSGRADLRAFYGRLGATVVAGNALGSGQGPRHERLLRKVLPEEVGVRGVSARRGSRRPLRAQRPVTLPLELCPVGSAQRWLSLGASLSCLCGRATDAARALGSGSRLAASSVALGALVLAAAARSGSPIALRFRLIARPSR
ncbi:hypothetical protein T492DRAFT_936433 [Pavlovales sp. CCMP2436]|nr:hypothetical protein T492DRAFT_936433 [Pavlovales sp. CCMP2436]|mmetsp:Transcript_3998/g.10169  ORF Transcript_3998/g.10169 Transcript_3998/m.10169 type:complete len:292 (+) Transcript_3998:83-958(+)